MSRCNSLSRRRSLSTQLFGGFAAGTPVSRGSLWAIVATVLLAAIAVTPSSAQPSHVLIVGGLGGTPEHTQRFERYLADTRRAFVEQFGVNDTRVTVLAENALSDRQFVDGVSTSENIASAFAQLGQATGSNDDIYIILFGHGSTDGTSAQLNIPRRDLSDSDYAAMLDGLDARRIVFVNTASSSGPFIRSMSAPNRIVITATRSGSERNETVFPRFFVEALSSATADLDRNGELTVAEVFRYAAENTARDYETNNHLATEHALLDDNGDGNGSELDELNEGLDGALASITRLSAGGAVLAAIGTTDRPEADALLKQKSQLEIDIASVKSQKSTLKVDAYYAELEGLFVSLARVNERIEGLTTAGQ